MTDETKFCCEQFAEEVDAYKDPVGGGYLYPPDMRPSGQIVYTEGWHVNGCCGGGCYVLSDIKFCPFCGTKLTAPA